MKFPQFFRTNKFERFNYEPRYYDPIKEEIEGKMKAARERANNPAAQAAYNSNISEAFRKRQLKSSNTSTIQILIAMALLGTFIGWMFYGNKVFYAYLLISPLYFYFRIKGKSKSTD